MHVQIVKRTKQLMKEGADGKRQAKKLMDDWSLQRAEEVVLICNAASCFLISEHAVFPYRNTQLERSEPRLGILEVLEFWCAHVLKQT